MGSYLKARVVGERNRQLVAYYKISQGLTLKECAARMGCAVKTAEFHWARVREQMRMAR